MKNKAKGVDREMIKIAEHGDVDAQYALGCCYGDGKGVEQNYKEAIK
jgi:TPR repeat protein